MAGYGCANACAAAGKKVMRPEKRFIRIPPRYKTSLRTFIHGKGRLVRTGSIIVYHIVRNLKSP